MGEIFQSDVFAVVYSNYHPREVDSLWWNEAEAQKKAEELGDGWEVERWDVEGKRPTR